MVGRKADEALQARAEEKTDFYSDSRTFQSPSPVHPFLPKWDKGMGDEGRWSKLRCFQPVLLPRSLILFFKSMVTECSWLSLLQLASPALPVGAYSYSEGVELLVERGRINGVESLQNWIEWELQQGAIALDGAVMIRAFNAADAGDWKKVQQWNDWSSASRETEELRQQSWQMGNALLRLLLALGSQEYPDEVRILGGTDCNFSVAFGISAWAWQIPPKIGLLGYLQSWANNSIGAGVKLIPLGQTAGQQLLFNLQPQLVEAVEMILTREDDALSSCTWGLSLASMQHETQYSRLFRS